MRRSTQARAQSRVTSSRSAPGRAGWKEGIPGAARSWVSEAAAPDTRGDTPAHPTPSRRSGTGVATACVSRPPSAPLLRARAHPSSSAHVLSRISRGTPLCRFVRSASRTSRPNISRPTFVAGQSRLATSRSPDTVGVALRGRRQIVHLSLSPPPPTTRQTADPPIVLASASGRFALLALVGPDGKCVYDGRTGLARQMLRPHGRRRASSGGGRTVAGHRR